MKELKQVGLKVTIPRVTILELLQSTDSNHHYTAEEVFTALREKGHDIGLATVYRVLSQFEQAGILVKHNFESGQAVFELETGDNHSHLICLKCNKIVEFTSPEIEAIQAKVAEDNGFTLEDYKLVLYGLCEDCR